MSAGMRTTHRIWRTLGSELVPEGHPEGAYLAYGVNDEVENRDADAVADILAALNGDAAEPAKPKAVAKPRNKQAAKPADK